MAHIPFVPLRCFSAYTMLDGAMEPKKIGTYAKERGFPAVALTDRNGLFAAMAFDDGCRDSGVQPITGSMLRIRRPGEDPAAPCDWIALYAQDEKGYENLCQLVSASHLAHPEADEAAINFTDLEGRTDGLIALTAGGEGALARLLAEEQDSAARAYCERLQSLFGDRLYIELCRRGDPIEEAAEEALIALALERDIPLVATNPACYADPVFHEAHDVMRCIATSAYVESDDREKPSPHLWMKSGPMMAELFADIPEALANTLVVAQRCATSPPRRKPILPSLAGDLEAEVAQLRADARAGLEERLDFGDISDPDKRQSYFERLEFELDIIEQMGFPGYFLIVADFIKWAKEQNIPVGPGRGSGAGSAVAWALTITDLDPIELGLLFERFLNPERVSMPDFDIDFCETRRGEVIRYVQQKYGSDQVAQIITFGKLKARAVLRDTGRVLQMPYGQVDRLTKLVPNHPTDPWTLERALRGGSNKDGSRHGPVQELVELHGQDRDVQRLFGLANRLEGFPRHSSTHAAGVVIGDRPLSELVPLYRDPRSDLPVTQFDMKFVEQAGLVKFDFLGLKTLSVLQKAVDMLARRGIEVDLARLPWDDVQVYELLKRGDTVGVFQLESEGMRRTLAAVKPTSFGDIIALVSLYRPGPMDNIPMFGRRKNGEEAIAYPHPLLEGILKETYGIFVYQEQVMQAAQILAGYSLGDADLLRRAMGKKIQAEMDKQRSRFVEGCADNDITPEKANELFDLIDKFAGYGFNKSHAAAYALLAYHTAWLKAHYPHEFYAASMCFDMHQTDKLNIFVDDMRRLGHRLLPPAINSSEADFSVEQDDDGLAVRYALAGIKNVGRKAMQAIIDERAANGEFTSLADFAERADSHSLNKRQIENLAAAGAFDALEPHRAAVHGGADMILSVAQAAGRARADGQGGLFAADTGAETEQLRLPANENWSAGEIMQRENEAFGFYFSAHPVSQYDRVTGSHGVVSHASIMAGGPPASSMNQRLAVLVEKARWRESARGTRYVQADLSDASGQFSSNCFEEEAGRLLVELAEKGGCALIHVEVDARPGDDTPRVTIRGAQPLDQLQPRSGGRWRCNVADEVAMQALINVLAPLSGGKCELIVDVPALDDSRAAILLGRRFNLDEYAMSRISALDGVDSLRRETVAPRPARAQKPPHLRLVG